jgi:ribonuclease BN (tRNA processing enzyme)
MITLTFLGVGAAVPAPGQTNSAYLIESGDARILFDCGPAILQQLSAVGRTPGDITHLFVSHGHGDHALGWPMFRLWWVLSSKGATMTPPVVVASDATWPHLRALWAHSYDDVPSQDLPAVELPADRPHTHQLTPAIRVSTWPMVHSTRYPVLAARFEMEGKVLAFTADAARNDNIVELARGADLLVHDSCHAVTVEPRREVQSRFHCTAQDAGEYASAAGAKSLALVHIGPDYAGRHAGLVDEARAKFAGHVFAPAAGEKVTV